MSLSPGIHLGPYMILSVLGKGGMGEVFSAKDTRLEREVAIKVLPEHLSGNADALKRFQREAKSLAALSHPNIVTIYDVGTEQSVSYVVMELLDGQTLRARIARLGLPWKKALEIAIPVAEGLSAAHSKGVIHRDLKPENIFLTSNGEVKILDFGLARKEQTAPEGDVTSFPTASHVETESGIVAGTVPYMSPEQVRGAVVDPRTDIFSFGCVFYEMLTGNRPFSGDSAAETVAAILKEDPQSLSTSAKQIPPELERAVFHCLEKNPDERFQSARDLTYDLKAILAGSGDSKSAAVGAWRASRLHRFHPSVWLTASILLLLAVGGYLYLQHMPTKAIDSLAVLPFENASKDPNTEYLSDGITENIINTLSQLPQIRVMARSTVFTYKGRQVDPRKVAHDLNVRAVLTGRVIQRADTLMVEAELVDAMDGSQLWGERYNRKLSDIFAVQEDISKEISERLRLKLTGEEKQKIAKHYTDNVEAYQSYLKGRYYAGMYTEEGLKKGFQYFHQAIQIDPNYALAYAGLAVAYWNVSNVQKAPKEVMPKAEEAALKALEIDDQLAEAHASVALVKMAYDWDRPAAEREYKRAIELNPGYASVYQWHGWHLGLMGRTDESISEMKRAQELDPLAADKTLFVGLSYYWARRYEQAAEQLRKALDMDPDFWWSYDLLGWIYIAEHKLPEALKEIQRAYQLDDNPWMLADIGYVYAVSGRKEEAEKVLNDLKDLSKKRYVSSYFIARIYAALGQKEQAFLWMQEAFDQRDESLTWLKVDPMMDSLHSDPRFTDLLIRLGLPR